ATERLRTPAPGTLDRETRARRSSGQPGFSISRRPRHELSRERRKDADPPLRDPRLPRALRGVADPRDPHPGLAAARARGAQAPLEALHGRNANLTLR